MNKAVIYFCLFFILITGVNAQTISLEQARGLALASSRSLAKYHIAIQSSILDEKSQLFSMLPQISADYRASTNYFTAWEFVNPVKTFSIGVGFSITQVIYQGGKSFIQKAISAIATESVRKDALAEYFNVLDSVDSAYYAVLEAAASLEAEDFSLKGSELAFAIAEIRNQTGMINHGDYLKSLADKESRLMSRNQAQRNLTLSLTKLRNLLGVKETPVPQEIVFDEYEELIARLSMITGEEADALYGELWKEIAANNISIAKASLNNQRAEKNYSLAKRDYIPTISATIMSGDFTFLPELKQSAAGNVSIRGTIPLDFWVLNNKLKKSRLSLDSAALDFANLENSLEQELFSCLSNIFAQAGAVLSSRRSLEYTQKHYDFVMERYRLSQSSVSDLNEAISLYMTSRNSLNKASYSFLQSLSKLRTLCAMEDEKKLMELLMKND